MMEKILPKSSLSPWVKALASSRRVFAPLQEDNGRWNYGAVSDGQPVTLDIGQTTLPPKKILFPQRETFLNFEQTDDGLILEEVTPSPEAVVVLGPRPCEAKAAWLLDKVFGGEISDIYYWKRRNAAALVGLACTPPPSPNCFCPSVNGSPHGEEGLDILLTDLGDRYLANVLTPKGEALVQAAPGLFTEAKERDRQEAARLHTDSEKKIRRKLKNSQALAGKLKGQFNSPLWDEESMSCIRCGICTYLCPSCHCFDINDEVEASASSLKGSRVRTWDTCQFPDFTMHSSGHNPRPDKASRLRQRLCHKFQYFVESFGHFQCVGCGRCISLCPVGIDIIKVLDKVSEHGA
jgi:sulfhydrogenase subunit beta (sulfur reductase)